MTTIENQTIYLNENSTLKGWVVLPCFKVESHGEDGEFEMVCNKVLGWIFTNMFAWLWNGKVHISKVYDGDRVVYSRWQGMLQGDMKNKEIRIHPTQKPVALYKWLLTKFAKKGDKILDTHCGSASSLVACYDLGFDAWGYEIDSYYYQKAKERLDEEMAQMRFL